MENALKDTLVSVIIPCFNQSRFLYQSVSSVLASGMDRVEVIVVDDGSTSVGSDRDFEEVLGISDKVRIIKQENGGLSSARNTGLREARGEFVQFLDADDMIFAGKLEAQIVSLRSNPESQVATCNYVLADEHLASLGHPEEHLNYSLFSLEDFLFHWERGFSIPIHTALIRRSSLADLWFDTELPGKEDWLFWTTLRMSGAKFSHLDFVGAVYRQHGESMRRDFQKMGTAFLTAAAKIELQLDKTLAPRFRSKTDEWHKSYYLENDKNQRVQPNSSKISREVDLELAEATQWAKDFARLWRNVTATAVEKPALGIVIPVYNNFEDLKSCLNSLLRQVERNFAVTLVDDRSSDARVNVLLDNLSGLQGIKIIRNSQNVGISSTQNVGVAETDTTYIGFLDCDDELVSTAVLLMLRAIDKFPNVDYFFSDREDFDVLRGTSTLRRYGGYPGIKFISDEAINSDLELGMIASHFKVIRRDLIQAIGGFDSRLTGVQDWDLALAAAKSSAKFHYLPVALYKYRIHGQSVTSTRFVSQVRKSNRVIRKHLIGREKQPLKSVEVNISEDLDLPSYDDLRKLAESKIRLTITFPHLMSLNMRNFVKERNGFFDHIAIPDRVTRTLLAAYLWDASVIDES